MLIASSSTIVGVMKSQASALSDRPRIRCTRAGCTSAARYAICDEALKSFMALAAPRKGEVDGCKIGALRPERSRTRSGRLSLELLAFLLEDGFPVLHQTVKRFLCCAAIR